MVPGKRPSSELIEVTFPLFPLLYRNIFFACVRYCFVQLAPDANTEKVIKMLENVKFGSGHLSVEKKSTKQEEEASPESIDPYT